MKLKNLVTIGSLSILAAVGCSGNGNDDSSRPTRQQQKIAAKQARPAFLQICQSPDQTKSQAHTIKVLFQVYELDQDKGASCADLEDKIEKGRKFLDLIERDITDLSPLSGLSKISALHLEGNPLTTADVDKLGWLPNLGALALDGTKITSLPDLEAYQNLKFLHLNDIKVKEISGFAENMPKGAKISLEMQNSSVQDFSPLADLNVQSLDISGLENPAAFETLPATVYGELNEIIVNNSKLTSLNSLNDKYPKLSRVEADDNAIGSLEGAKFIRDGFDLSIARNKLSSFSGPRLMKNLVLAGNPIQDFSFVKDIEVLGILDLSNTAFSEWSNLAQPRYRVFLSLHLKNTPIEKITVVSDDSKFNTWQNLRRIDISGTQIADLTPFTQLKTPSLRYFSAVGIPVTREKCPVERVASPIAEYCRNRFPN